MVLAVVTCTRDDRLNATYRDAAILRRKDQVVTAAGLPKSKTSAWFEQSLCTN